MSNTTLFDRIRVAGSVLARIVARYIWIVNLALSLFFGLWIYFLVDKSYFKVQKDFEFMKENISNISYMKLDYDALAAIEENYQKKRTAPSFMPPELTSPF